MKRGNMTELNEMELLEKNIINRYNEILKALLEEGDMDALEKVITDENYREEIMRSKRKH